MGGTTTISTSETRAEALKLQSSSYGAAVPVVHGKTRIAGNLLRTTVGSRLWLTRPAKRSVAKVAGPPWRTPPTPTGRRR